MGKVANVRFAPQVDRWLQRTKDGEYPLEGDSPALVEEFFRLIEKIAPCGSDERREVWVRAPRGGIRNFGNFKEYQSEGEVETYEEFIDLWQEYYPEKESWYQITTMRHEDYRVVFVGSRIAIQVNPPRTSGWGIDISPFVRWLMYAVGKAIDLMAEGKYNEFVRKNLPAVRKTGTISRKEYLDLFPAIREEYRAEISPADIAEFVTLAEAQDEDAPQTHLAEMTAATFYQCCALGYEANGYQGREGHSAKEQYYLFADGRDDGLQEIDENSPQAFSEWYHDKQWKIGHPWEVCRGGNSTHVSLYILEDEKGYYFCVAGRSYSRSIEAIKFYLALHRAGYPVRISDAKALAARFTETDKIGIVPQGRITRYCEGDFPGEKIIDFINLPYEKEKAEKIAERACWQPIAEQKLL